MSRPASPAVGAHPERVAARLCLGALPRIERDLVAHLLACAPCRAAPRRAWSAEPWARDGVTLPDLPEEPPAETRYDDALDRVAALAGEQADQLAERRRPADLLDELWLRRPASWAAFFARRALPFDHEADQDGMAAPERSRP